ncbi:hypothetical protein [Humibacter ginsenosidimutans]|uniref:Uncharacterized protein n=1 Tax=Humibacter ginsenosidimutans TaxID=2599293 RepID=A0A5B8M6D2_9MICO|nr:hypothetical protein [Humibacter ginsenosidimutans]QDZ15866.1 hypothetical protein FPZ11_14770 [Humibacter ginsenosidimutans]
MAGVCGLAILSCSLFGVCLEFSGGLSEACLVDVGIGVRVDRAESAAQFGGCGWLIGSAERREEAVVDLRVEDRDAYRW